MTMRRPALLFAVASLAQTDEEAPIIGRKLMTEQERGVELPDKLMPRRRDLGRPADGRKWSSADVDWQLNKRAGRDK